MKKRPLSALALGFLVLGTALVLSCTPPVQETPSPNPIAALIGTWESSWGERLEITETTFRNLYNGTTVNYVGTIEDVVGGTSGYITIKVTERGEYGPTIGKYYTVYWKNLSSTGMAYTSPYKAGSAYNNGMDTLSAAKAEYTVEKGYFDVCSDMIRK